MSARRRLMTHLVSHFPNRALSLTAAEAMIDGGASYLEVQFPFSDPSADGKLIQTACTQALAAGFTVEGGFDLVRELRGRTELPIFVMSYGNLVFRRGVRSFVERAKAAGATGLIVPDLMPGYDEGLFRAGAAVGVEVIPVVAPTISDPRLAEVAALAPHFLYAALRVGITGSYTEIGEENRRFLQRLAPIGAKVLAGFGISSREQVESLAAEVHALVVGSALVRIIIESAIVPGSGASEATDGIEASQERVDPARIDAGALYERIRDRVAGLTG